MNAGIAVFFFVMIISFSLFSQDAVITEEIKTWSNNIPTYEHMKKRWLSLSRQGSTRFDITSNSNRR